MYLISEDYLAHHGIKGQKWGVRRYQNKDGTRTALGKAQRKEGLKGAIKSALGKAKEASAAKKSSKQESSKEALRKRIIANPKLLPKKAEAFSKKEIDQLIEDIRFNRKLQDIKNEEVQRGIDSYATLGRALQTTSSALSNLKSTYNIAAEVHNAFVDAGKISGKAWTIVGQKAEKKDDRSAIERIVRTGTAAEVKKAIGQMTSGELEAAMKRFNSEKTLDELIRASK